MKTRLALILAAYACITAAYAQTVPAGTILRLGHGNRDEVTEYYDYVLANTAFSRAGIEIELVEAPFPRILEMARQGTVDVVCNTLKTKERMEYLVFPETPLVEYEQCLFAVKGEEPPFEGDLSRLEGLTVGIVRGFSYSPAFDGLISSGKITSVTTTDTEQLARMLYYGRISLMIDNPIGLKYETRTLPGFWSKVREIRPPVASQPAYVAFSRGSPAALASLAAFDRALAAMKADGTWDAIMALAVAQPNP